VERCKSLIVSFSFTWVTNSSGLDWYHCTLLHLVVCCGISHDEVAQQENQECKVGVINYQPHVLFILQRDKASFCLPF
jgi:hypothetical protein